MSNRFHSKFHRANHHTYPNASNPDAGHDPIASYDNPFRGDFVLTGALSAVVPSTSAYAAAFIGGNVGIGTATPNVALTVIGSISAMGNLTIGPNNSSINTSNIIGANNLAGGQYATAIGNSNIANGYYSSTLGGRANSALSAYSTVVNGRENIASGYHSFIGGGILNNTNLQPNTFIFGSNLTASKANFTYVNNLSSQVSISTNILSANNASVYANTNFEALRITQMGTGDSFRVDDQANDSSPFIIDNSGNVVIGGLTPTSNNILTINGNISSYGNIIVNGGNSIAWNSNYTNVNKLSANWNNVYATFAQQSADNLYINKLVHDNYQSWNPGEAALEGVAAYTSVSNLSSGWQQGYTGYTIISTWGGNTPANSSVYLNVNKLSANWNSVYSNVLTLSSNWNQTYTYVNRVTAFATPLPVISGSVRNIVVGTRGAVSLINPTVIIDAPTYPLGSNNRQATAIPVVDGSGNLLSIKITDAGFGYTTHPRVYVYNNGVLDIGYNAYGMADIRATFSAKARESVNNIGILYDDGSLYMSGYGTLGSVPNGYSIATAINYLTPTTCSLSLPSYRPVEMWRSSYNTYVLDSLGNLHAAGSNSVNQLGLGKAFDSLAYSSKLDKITFTTNLSTQIIKFASTPLPTDVTTNASSEKIHCIALATDGTIYTWGFNTNGQCGLNNLSVVYSPSAVNYTPQYCAGSTKAISAYPAFNYKANSGTVTTPSLMFKDVYAGSIISFVLKNDGTAYGAGWNGNGALANGITIGGTTQATFAPVLSGLYDKMLYGINRIYVADNGNLGGSPLATTYFLLNDGSLWASGNGASGELGLGTTVKSLNYASKITIPDTNPVTLFQASYSAGLKGSAIAYTSGNKLYSWGYNDQGQLSNGTSSTTGQFSPSSVIFTVTEGYTTGNPLNDCTVVEIIMCGSSSALLLSDGSVWTAGDNTDNQGAGAQSSTVANVTSFTKVRLPYNEKAARISYNGRGYKYQYTLVIITQSGKVYGCGTNANGELGLGNTNGYYYLPTRIYNI